MPHYQIIIHAQKVATAISNAILTSQALQEGNLTLLSAATHDIVHEPYRQKLIPNFEIVQQIVKKDTDGILLISGSGSTCLCIAKKELSTAARLKICITSKSLAMFAIRRCLSWHRDREVSTCKTLNI